MRIRGLVAVAAAAFAVAACAGDGGGVAANDYARQVCGALVRWQQSIQQATTDLTTGLGTNASPQEGKQALQDYLGQALSETNRVVDRIEGSGVPDVEGGERAAQQLQQGFRQIQSEFEQARRQAGQLSTDSPQAFQADAEQLSRTIQSGFAQIGTSLQSIGRNQELDRAFEEQPACNDVQGT